MMLLTLNDVADRLRVTRRTLYRWIKEGKFHAIKVGGCWRVLEEDYQQYLNDARKS